MKGEIHNIQSLKERRRQLRSGHTPTEAKLWSFLKGSQLESRKFRRQHSVGPYILDFYCPEEKLCIELDGESHYTEAGFEHDRVRTEFLNSLNIQVLRFENNKVFENMDTVLEEIKRHFQRP